MLAVEIALIFEIAHAIRVAVYMNLALDVATVLAAEIDHAVGVALVAEVAARAIAGWVAMRGLTAFHSKLHPSSVYSNKVIDLLSHGLDFPIHTTCFMLKQILLSFALREIQHN
jgi:hypothetical protein